jgi:hypothetical protein
MMSFEASSAEIGNSTASSAGTKKASGGGVGHARHEGRNHRPLPGIAPAMISAGAEQMKTSDQLPLTGNSTSPTLRIWLPDWRLGIQTVFCREDSRVTGQNQVWW